MAETEIQVGHGLDRAIADVADAWTAYERGAPIESSDRIYIRDWATLYAVLTPDRYAILRHLRRSSARDVRHLADALDRDAGSVEADVVALEAFGLLNKAADGALSSDIDEIASTIRVAA